MVCHKIFKSSIVSSIIVFGIMNGHLSFCNQQSTSSTSNELKKIFNHRISDAQLSAATAAEQSKRHLELGKVVFNFSQKPIINLLPERSPQKNKALVSFLFPMVVIKDTKLHAVIDKFNKEQSGLYSARIEMVTRPVSGLKLTLVYDPEKVAYEYQSFQSMGLHRNVVFRFYNKELLEQIRKQDSSILRVAQVKKKRSLSIQDMAARIQELVVLMV